MALAATLAAALTVPVPATLELCPRPTGACRSQALGAGESVVTAVAGKLESGNHYVLRLRLAPGRHALSASWVLRTEAMPEAIDRIELSGAADHTTELLGSIELLSLGGHTEEVAPGMVAVVFPESGEFLRTLSLPRPDRPAYPQLYDDRAPLHLARWPSLGWGAVVDYAPGSAREPGVPEWEQRRMRVGLDVPLERWQSDPYAWVWGLLHYDWNDEQLRWRGVVPEQHLIALDRSPQYGIAAQGRFRVLNARSELHSARDYVLEPGAQRILLRSEPGRDPLMLRVTRFDGPLLRLEAARHVAIGDLSLAETAGDALEVASSSDIELSDLSIRDAGIHGVRISASRAVTMRRLDVERVGQSGVILDGGDRVKLVSGELRLLDSRIADVGRVVLTPQAAVQVKGVGAVVRGNTIERSPHLAIYFEGNDHLITDNRIADVCLETGDAGAIYAGRDWSYRGNRLLRNVIARAGDPALNSGGAAIYLDDFMSGTEVSGNLLIDGGYGVLIGGGRDNTVTGNAFVRVRVPVRLDARGLGWARQAIAPGGELPRRLADTLKDAAAWRERYPQLFSLMDEHVGEPSGNIIEGNRAYASGHDDIADEARSTGRIGRTQPLQTRKGGRGGSQTLTHCCAESWCRAQLRAAAETLCGSHSSELERRPATR
jgi:hypothetical protein